MLVNRGDLSAFLFLSHCLRVAWKTLFIKHLLSQLHGGCPPPLWHPITIPTVTFSWRWYLSWGFQPFWWVNKFPGSFPCVLMQAHLYPSCLTLWASMEYSLPGSSVHGIFQARKLEWVDIFSSRGSFWPRDQTFISYVSCIGRQILYHWANFYLIFLLICFMSLYA